MKYGDLPTIIGDIEIDVPEMMFYQYLPIKLKGETSLAVEERLSCFNKIIGIICCDFIGEFGLDRFVSSYIYLTAKHLYQTPNNSFNRDGWHSDGFMTNDINYIWSNKFPTIFNKSDFILSLNDSISLEEMKNQALIENNVYYKENQIIRLNQFNIHKVAPIEYPSLRSFIKVSISHDKYDLKGNSHNHLLTYKWDMKPRKNERNIPQSNLNTAK